jgi:hypothetical protein
LWQVGVIFRFDIDASGTKKSWVVNLKEGSGTITEGGEETSTIARLFSAVASVNDAVSHLVCLVAWLVCRGQG